MFIFLAHTGGIYSLTKRMSAEQLIITPVDVNITYPRAPFFLFLHIDFVYLKPGLQALTIICASHYTIISTEYSANSPSMDGLTTADGHLSCLTLNRM